MSPIRLVQEVTKQDGGWRVRRDDGTTRMVLQRPSLQGYAVFSGMSNDRSREPQLGFPGSWCQNLDDAIEWARMDGIG